MTECYDKIQKAGGYSKGISKTRAVDGDIRKISTHGAEAIVNSENAGMGWGGGISGNIQIALGAEAGKVDQQRKELMRKFNELVNQDNDNNGEDTKYTCPQCKTEYNTKDKPLV